MHELLHCLLFLLCEIPSYVLRIQMKHLCLVQLVMAEKRFATVMWGGFDFVADVGGSEPDKQEWLMECSGLQASSPHLNNA